MSDGEVTTKDDPRLFADVLRDCVRIMDALDRPYAFFGSIASTAYGRPGSSGDIDVLVRPQDADATLEAFAEAGYDTKKDNPQWLYKAFDRGVMVDVIFRVKREIYLDEDMAERRRTIEFEGVKVPVISPEDAIVIAAASNDGETPDHWYNAMSIMAEDPGIDWDYLVRRARQAPRRVLSLLIYAQSNDVLVPDQVVRRLIEDVYRV